MRRKESVIWEPLVVMVGGMGPLFDVLPSLRNKR